MHIQGEEKLMHMLSFTCICTTCAIYKYIEYYIQPNVHVFGLIMNIIDILWLHAWLEHAMVK